MTATPTASRIDLRDFRNQGQFPERIRRCFMTGKQCIFRSQGETDSNGQGKSGAEAPFCKADGNSEGHAETGPEITQSHSARGGVFVVMPFRPNLDAFFEWSLTKYIQAQVDLRSEEIRRADQFRDIGYVMCEKICRRIQDAELVVADLSIPNSNVFYELGMAVGLNKALMIVCDSGQAPNLGKDFWTSIGLDTVNLQANETPSCVVKYPNVGFLTGEGANPIREKVTRVPLSPLRPEMKIVALLIPKNPPMPQATDIEVTFEAAIEAAVGVAVDNLNRAAQDLDGTDLTTLKKPDRINLLLEKDGRQSFKDVAAKVDTAFACIIDLADENPHSYFWLGYCHARGVSAIPIYRSLKAAARDAGKDSGILEALLREHVQRSRDESEEPAHGLAFDIRALWYIHFTRSDVKTLARTLQGVLEELIRRDLPRLQRNIFWERLTRSPRVHIYTGAVHHGDLNREVVGDWDQRTVSEFVRYLSGGDEAVVPQLERPVYSPKTIKEKLDAAWSPPDSINRYIDLVKGELKNKNCLIIASADVNPLTEVALAYAYGLQDKCFQEFNETQENINAAVIALKDPSKDEGIPTFFCSSIKDPKWTDGARPKWTNGHRGFYVDESPVGLRYHSQDDAKVEFSLLAHLLIMQNVFSDAQHRDNTMIVVLNGVSGPGTFGLAELLTGGVNHQKRAEELLAKINEKWRECVSQNAQTPADGDPKPYGIEAFVEVKIQPQEQPGPPDPVRDKFYDKRDVVDFVFVPLKDPEKTGASLAKAFRSGNPRQIAL